ncbi:MAG: hypothetical protein FWD91_08455 [Treponema sp.]|nr:hypothetical protein [Treponema sp.]
MHKSGYKHSEFTPEEQEQLRQSPHVKRVTAKRVWYTVEFKEMFWEQYNASKMQPELIFMDAGIDPKVLGMNRVWGLVTMLRRAKERGEDFQDVELPQDKKKPPPEPKPEIPKPPTPRVPRGFIADGDIRKLFHQVAYMTQELEFIKKIISAETDGRSKK